MRIMFKHHILTFNSEEYHRFFVLLSEIIIEAEIELYGEVKAGLCLYYNADYNVGTGFDSNRRYRYRRNKSNGV